MGLRTNGDEMVLNTETARQPATTPKRAKPKAATGSAPAPAAAAGGILGRITPRILHAAGTSPDRFAEALGQATTLGFDTLLLPEADVPPALAEAARGLGVSLLVDVRLDRAPGDADLGADAPFIRLPEPSLDPRTPMRPSGTALASLATAEDVDGLASWWGPRLLALRGAGVAGVRLLGLDALPGWAVARILPKLRQACPGVLLFGWTPGVAWPVLEALPAGTLDLVASSLPWWDGRAGWFWQELDLLRRVAPVVADPGSDARRETLAAMLAEGWMATGEARDAEMLNRARSQDLAGLPWSRLVSPAGSDVVAILRTDAPDPRRAQRAALAATALSPGATLPASLVLTASEGHFGPFSSVVGAGEAPLGPAETMTPASGGLLLYAATVRPEPVADSLARKRAEAAAEQPRLAIEAPSPCVEGGRFPARQVVGSLVTVEADIIGDGHDTFSAVLRWQGPGETAWTEAPMTLLSNDRWTAQFPLERLGVYHYTIEAWRDVYATFAHELETKYAAGVPITLELQEGVALVKQHTRNKRGLRAALAPVMPAIEKGDMEMRRIALLAPETMAVMAQADPRPRKATMPPVPVQAERSGAAFASWYEVFPRSMSDDVTRHGTFRDVIKHLPRIGGMGFDVLYFPPFHPIGTTNRKGPNNTLTPGPDDPGSPYAIGSAEGGHDALHLELGSLEDLQHLRQAAAAHGIELAMDFAIQCSPDHPWLAQHKDWFNWRPDGSIRYAENPPKKYEDIVNVDFYAAGAAPDLWIALAEAVLFWASQGIRLFRVDNPHTKPLPFWEWMIAEVQARYPDAVFLAEAFTRPKVMYRLAKAGFSQSYTYFTWRNTKAEFEEYLTELTQGPAAEFFRPHFFVNTPDINPVPLQTAPRSGFLTRAALAATLSGLWGVYNGFELCDATPLPGREEYLNSEKYQLRAWEWGRPGNIEREIGQLNAIRKRNPALHTHLGVTFLRADNPQVLLFEKATPDRSNVLLVAINMDLSTPQSSRIDVPFWRWAERPAALEATDLVQDRSERWHDASRFVSLTSEQPYAIWRITPAKTGAGA